MPLMAASTAISSICELRPVRVATWGGSAPTWTGLKPLVVAKTGTSTQAFARRLFDAGVFTPAIVFPTVARGQARVRTIVTADHTEADLDEALGTFERVGRELGLLG